MFRSKQLLKQFILLASMIMICVIISSCGDSETSKQKLESGLYPMYEKGSVQDRWGYVDETGEHVIQPQFSYADKFYEGMAVACDLDTGLYGYIDSFGEWVIPPQFDWASGFVNGYAVVAMQSHENSGGTYTTGQKEGCIDIYGEYILEPEYERVFTDKEKPGKFLISKDGQTYIWIDEDFEVQSVISKDEYEEINDKAVLEHLEVVFDDDNEIIKWINEKGDVEETNYDEFYKALESQNLLDDYYIGYYENGMCPVIKEYYGENDGYEGYLYGFMDSNFELVTEIIYFTFDDIDAGYYDDGIALVRTLPDEDGLVSYGYIGKDGKWLIKKQYSSELDSYDMY